VRWMLMLYPRSWRRRYGEEVGDLSEELLAAGEATRLRLGLELVRSAFVERVHRRRAIVLLSSCAAVVLLVGVVLFATHGPGRDFSANGSGGTSTTVASSTTTTNPISPDALPSSIPGHIDALGYAHYSDVYGGVVATDGEAHLDVYLTDLDPSIESAFAALAPRGDISFLSTANTAVHLTRVEQRINKQVSTLMAEGIQLNVWGPSVETGTDEIDVVNGTASQTQVLDNAFGSSNITVVDISPSQAAVNY
jgi:hypothetical protein